MKLTFKEERIRGMLKLVIIAGLQLERSKGGLGSLGCFIFFWLDSGKFPMCLELV